MNKLQVLVLIALLFVQCRKEEAIVVNDKQYGFIGTHEVSKFTEADYAYTSVYFPSDIATMDKKTPLVLLVSGWFGTPKTSEKYETLLKFIASHGYTVIYTDEGSTTDEQFSIKAFNKMLSSNDEVMKTQIMPNLDTTRIGVIGHSAGGGIAFTVLDYFSNNNEFGSNGRFVIAYDPWFAFGMSKAMMQALPNNTNAVILKFGVGGNNDMDGTDARIPLTEFYLLTSIAASKKDYQIYDKENAAHNYPTGSGATSAMQGVLVPLDALLDYTFVAPTEKARQLALEKGSDDPYANGHGAQIILENYKYPCDGSNTLIDYCSIAD